MLRSKTLDGDTFIDPDSGFFEINETRDTTETGPTRDSVTTLFDYFVTALRKTNLLFSMNVM